MPMAGAVSHLQGRLGFRTAQTCTNERTQRGHDQVGATIITPVLVDADDPAFADPGKPIGRTLTRDEADRFAHDEGWRCKEVQPGKYRRVVPSPIPRRIMESETIPRAVETRQLPVPSGGRGAGSITAAQFLQRFVGRTPWAHLDIAGVTWTKKDLATAPKGATAFGVRLLDRLVADHYEKK